MTSQENVQVLPGTSIQMPLDTKVSVRGWIGQWDIARIQRMLTLVEKYSRQTSAKRENLMYARAHL